MTRHEDWPRVRHMLDYATEAMEMAHGHRREDLDTDRRLRHALTRVVEVIGEAAAHVSQDFRTGHREIPWRSIIGLRNRLIHGYDEVDLDVLWDIVQLDLPPLVDELRKALGQGM